MSRVREDLGWTAQWDVTFRGYAINFIKQNSWRCEAFHDFDDLLQDAYLTFRRVKSAYPRVTEPKNFMSLYKTALRNEMFDKARYKQVKSDVDHISLDEDEPLQVASYTHEGVLKTIIAELPIEARMALRVMMETPELLRKKHQRSKLAKLAGVPEVRENLNMRLRRILKLPDGVDLVGPLREALTGE